MVRNLRADSSGVASTVATMLSLLVMLLFLDLAIVQILPAQQSDAEFVATESAISSLEQIHGLAEGPMIAGGPTQILPAVSVPIPLGTQGVSPLEAPTSGTLTFDSAAGTAKVYFTFVPHFNKAKVTHIDEDIVLAIDSSGSMTWNDPMNLRLSSAKEYISRLTCPDHVASVDFDDSAHLTRANIGGPAHHLTGPSNNCFPNFAAAAADIDTIDSSGGTNIGGGLQVSVSELLGYGDARKARVVILLTDGQNNFAWQDDLTKAQARRARDAGIVVYTIGLGADADEALLRYVADTTGGTYYHASTASEIRWIYFEISRHYTSTFICGDLVSSDGGLGRLSLELRNRQYPAQTLTYESGGIIRRQSDGSRVVDGPNLQWQSTAAKGPAGTLSLDVVGLTGADFRLDGSQTQLVAFRPLGRDLQEIQIVKTNLTTVKAALTSEEAALDYWVTQGAATAAGVATVKAPIDLAKNALTTAQSKQNNGNLTSAKFDVDSASAQISSAIVAAQNAAVAGTMQKWLADQTTDDLLVQGCYLTQWVNWYSGVSIEVTSQDATAWGNWLNRTAASTGMQWLSSRFGSTAVLTIRAVDRLTIERRILSVSIVN